MANSTELLHHFYLTIDGADAAQDLMRDLELVTVENSLHLPDAVSLRINDPQLRWIDAETLAPGKTLKVSARTAQGSGDIFDGEIVELEPDFEESSQRLVVRAFDRLHRLARGRHIRSFVNVTDGDLVETIADELRLQAKVGPTPHIYPYVFQANESNLGFLQRRAAAIGFHLYVEGETLYFVEPASGGTTLELIWGNSLVEFRPRLTTIGQVNRVTVRGWDPKARTEIIGEAGSPRGGPAVSSNTRGGGEAAKAAFSLDAPLQVADRPIRNQTLADQLAQAIADQHAGRFITAECLAIGDPRFVAGVTVQIRGVGDRFSGTYVITGTAHHYSSQTYTTTLMIAGLHPETLMSLLAPEPTELLTSSLVIGIVTNNNDPEGWGRVKVRFPWLSAEHASDWARVVVPGGGAERGIAFLPEIDDEVLVGFELGDIHFPYVIGGLWNGKDHPPDTEELVGSGEVRRRVIRSRSGHTVVFDDGPSSGVTISDRVGNTIRLDSEQRSLTIEAKGDLNITAGGRVVIKGVTIDLN